VYVPPPAITFRFGRGDFTAEFTAWAVTGAAGRSTDLARLGELLELAAAALGWAAVRADPADLLIPHQAAPLPAYRIVWTEQFRHQQGANHA
jgi:hypothetical protein